MTYEEFDACYRYVACEAGGEAFDNMKNATIFLTKEEFELAFTFARDAAIIAGTSFKSEVIEVDPLVAEYCAFTEEQKTVLFEEIPGMVIDAFMDMCSSFKERSRCKRFEQYLVSVT
ncbi:hypothetical protein CEXT_305961 [Caerostris extrusa]|uniref:Uncharacterized protein n=1 Tax=Caerostris extrusa TaxID=172846 RepID=A0AAV4U3S7_CAEEX|nr:hypothetical protein CEXT_305961 [Caerostris extrusa]